MNEMINSKSLKGIGINWTRLKRKVNVTDTRVHVDARTF